MMGEKTEGVNRIIPNFDFVIKALKSHANQRNVEGMARFGISGKNVLGGPSIPVLRKMARDIGRNHQLAVELWRSEIHEARILAGLVADPTKATKMLMEKWAKDFDSWDVCDHVCSNFFDKTRFAHKMAAEWSSRKGEFVKRAGFVLMAALAVHDKEAGDARFLNFFSAIKRGAVDERNFVKKAVNWALRQIGKRNKKLNEAAIALAGEISMLDSKSARWVAKDALRELKSGPVMKKLIRNRGNKRRLASTTDEI